MTRIAPTGEYDALVRSRRCPLPEPSVTDRTPLASPLGDRRWPTDQEILEATITTDYRT
jgi:hypothetical protein